MSVEQVVELARRALQLAFLMSAPLLGVAMVVSVIVSLVQALTSVQENTVATVPRLAAVAAAVFFMMPWMLRQIIGFTTALFSDLARYAR